MGIRGLDAWLTTPPVQDEFCSICGNDVDHCICPECPVCGTIGDPLCYEKHGMIRSQAQIDELARIEKWWEEKNRLESEAEHQAYLEDKELAAAFFGATDE